MIRLRAFVAVVVALVAAAAAADERGFAVDGRAVQLIDAGAKKPAPLVVALHCYGCAPEHLPDKLGLAALARQHGFVVAVPAGMKDHEGSPFWNATEACCDFDRKKPDDVGYVVHVIDELVRRGVADGKRVYLVGFSSGGFLAWRIACDHADKIAAIASIGGGAPTTCKPSAAVAVLEVHGSADTTVPVAGGKLGDGLPQLAIVPSARAALDAFARVDGCAPPDGAGRRRCTRAAAELWMLPGGHWPTVDAGFGGRLWSWLAAQHK